MDHKNKKINSILSSHDLNDKIRQSVVKFVQILSDRLNDMKETDAKPFKSKLFHDIMYPLYDKRFQIETTFMFQPPKVHLIGSFLSNCSIKNDDHFVVDVGLEMPSKCFIQKDHLNYVYFRKRALYLTCVANYLSNQADIVTKLQYQYLNGDSLKPVLLFISSKFEKHIRFRLLPFPASEKGFQSHKLGLDRNNLKHCFNGIQVNFSPVYNSSILADILMHRSSKILSEYFEASGNLESSIKLLKLWLDSRNLKHIFSHILSVFTCQLINDKHLNYHLSTLQIFRSIIEAITKSQWDIKGAIFDHDRRNDFSKNFCEEYHKNFSVVFVDISSGLNLCYNVHLDDYKRLCFEAQITLKQLQNNHEPIDELFRHVDFSTYFDEYIFISNDYLKSLPINVCNDANFVQTGFNIHDCLLTKIIWLINFSICNRILLVQRKSNLTYSQTWDLNEPPPHFQIKNLDSSSQFLTIGILINTENAFDKLIKGPLADKVEDAQKFRSVWGDKAEIRRFQDGEIREAVFFDVQTMKGKREILMEIVKYILDRNLNIHPKYIVNHSSCLDSLLDIPSLKLRSSTPISYGTGDEFNTFASENALLLKRYLHNLSDLSFSIIDVMGISDCLRSTGVFPPLPLSTVDASNTKFFNKLIINDTQDNKLTFIRPINMVIKIESNTKFLANNEAISNQKYLFLNEISRSLSKKHAIVSRTTPTCILVFFSCYVFRLTLAITKEFSILRSLNNSLSGSVRTYQNSKLDHAEFESFTLAPITACLSTLAKNNPAFAMTCRIFKRWLSLQLIAHYFEDVTCDLIVAYSFQYFNFSHPQPRSALKGFLQVLNFLKSTDFREHALIINFNETFTRDDIDEIQASFFNDRQNLPALFIVTPYDKKHSCHTRNMPNALILNHLKRQANVSLTSLKRSLQLFPSFNIKKLLRPSQSQFDIIIELNSKIISNKYESIDFPENIIVQKTLYQNSDEATSQIVPVTDFCPNLQYLNNLRKNFNNLALFFYDQYGGRRIGVLLKPDIMEQKPFKAASLEASILTGIAYSHNLDFVTVNLGALLEDFSILGDGIVSDIRIESDRLFKDR